MEGWRKAAIANFTDLAADARELGDEETAEQAMKEARDLGKGASGK
jgi:hypothetical protein